MVDKADIRKFKNDLSFEKIDYLVKYNLLSIFPEVTLTLKYVWGISHFITIIGTIGYFLTIFNFSKLNLIEPIYFKPTIWYYSADLGAILTYSIVIFISINNSMPELVPFTLSKFLKFENSHLLSFAMLWLFTPITIFKILPFTLYSLLNLSNYLAVEVFPDSSLAELMNSLIEILETPLLLMAAHLDLILFPIILMQSINQQNFYPYVIYSIIWCLRIESSEVSKTSLYCLIHTIDNWVQSSSYVDKYSYEKWTVFRTFMDRQLPLRLSKTESIDTPDADEGLVDLWNIADHLSETDTCS
ncbi:uncharacterized protein ASCRUDRAFT_72896 [Ascoidea rubescens DSM 1968]|uniref:Uncharacterized protein n=1 Tax=Ascoidea rubescens DSM 1968 TaxID=1344418 RepID=A0A1D2V8Q3_9ASCO|nr:hypothetical protein ASCRUDRAFT_72896 [Ascoidea rubescens DSM 1968]ODV58032.1 hypothetical protein ASCRUDRAFT_72896 [Ascoidea rubescens DSM 1968]